MSKDSPSNTVQQRIEALEQFHEGIEQTTVESLGTEQAFRIIDVHAQNWIDLVDWLPPINDDDTDLSFLNTTFATIFSKLRWQQLLFLRANYGAVVWHAREILEGVSLVLSVTHRGRTLSVDEQVQRAASIEDEETAREWIGSALRHTLDYDDDSVEAWMDEWWTRINKHVHASPQRMLATTRVSGVGSLVTDAFDEELATSSLTIVDEVCDLCWAVMLNEYPSLQQQAVEAEFFPTNAEEARHVASVVATSQK